ncbi:helix-turn-helix transcriptional regulator [Polymorphospora sp. NPDC050346]|uniref:helix-turn-helix domain-containing protein n=1 Tax=Polymorphospora sp. NPDC050346 TaxID=3155780 RepID=UPI0033FB2357
MRSRSIATEPIGDRLRMLRLQRNWSIRHAASLAGISHVQWGRLERGERSADNRFMLAALAKALNVPLAELTGSGAVGLEHGGTEAKTAIYHTMQAVIEADLEDAPAVAATPIERLVERLDLVVDLRLKCDYIGAAKLIPSLLQDLHAAAFGDERERALEALVLAQDTASFVVRYLGDPTSSVMIADRGRQAASYLQDPVMLGMAAWSQAHAASGCGLYARALRIAERAVTELEPHTGNLHGKEMLGQLYMVTGFAKWALGDTTTAEAAIAEAAKLAQLTGQSPALGLNFGPTAIDVWRVSINADAGDPRVAVRIAQDADPAGLAAVSRSRQAAFYIDTARALSNINKDTEALRMLLHAERLAPQRVRLSPLVSETVRHLLEKSRRGSGWTELRALCERVGVQP